MDTFILRIQRQSGGVCGIGLATEVTIDGANKRLFKAGDIQEYNLPRKNTSIRFFNSAVVGKDMEDSFVLNPENHKTIIITFCYKMNPKYFMPWGAFRHPQFLFDRQILFDDHDTVHNQKANLTQVQSEVSQTAVPQSPQSPTTQPDTVPTKHISQDNPSVESDYKFCTNCGARNKSKAKFCIKCGEPFD